MRRKIVPIIFIVLQTILELAMYCSDLKIIFEQDSWVWRTLLVFWIVTYFCVFSFYVGAAFTDPGYLSFNWLKDIQKIEGFKSQLDENGEKCYCSYCNMPRPLRTHHCSTCGRCVLLMDHHCDFIGNCVGFRNYKQFFMFLLWFLIDEVLTIALTVYRVLQKDGVLQVIWLLISFVYFGGLGLIVGTQLFVQIGFAIRNSTWIESEGQSVRKSLYKRAKIEMANRYDIGVCNNCKQRLGPTYSWCIPTPNNGNAYYFRENPKYVPVYELQYKTTEPGQELVDTLDQESRYRFM